MNLGCKESSVIGTIRHHIDEIAPLALAHGTLAKRLHSVARARFVRASSARVTSLSPRITFAGC